MANHSIVPKAQEPAFGCVRVAPPVHKRLAREDIPPEFVQWWKVVSDEQRYLLLHGGVSPLIEVFKRGRDVGIKDASEKIELLCDTLYRVLPYLEDARDDPSYKKGAVQSVINLVTDALGSGKLPT